MKTCRGCGEVKGIAEFYRHPQMPDGHLNFCKPCIRERARIHRLASDLVRERDRERYHAGLKKTRPSRRTLEMSRAHNAVRRAIHGGRLVRPASCEECGAEGMIEAARYDYRLPLEIRWLCQRCHRRWDSKEPKSRAVPF